MCIKSKTPAPVVPAAAPAPPTAPPEEPEVGRKRKEENMDNFGADTPNYRVSREGTPQITPQGQIRM